MNKYETVFIMNSTITDEQKNSVINKIEKYISDNGEITKKENLGIRKLAYDIKKQNTGHYYVIEFLADSQTINELERLYRITDEIIKFIVIRNEN